MDSFAEKATQYIGSPASLILHTLAFVVILALPFFNVIALDTALLALTTAVSLEAIYLALFIQMSINKNTAQLEAVEEDLEEIQEDVEEITEDVEGIEKNVKEIQEDVEEIHDDVEEMSEDMEGIQKNVEDISEDIEEIQEDVEEITEDVEGIEKSVEEISHDVEEIQEDVAELEDESAQEVNHDKLQEKRIEKIESLLQDLYKEIQSIKK